MKDKHDLLYEELCQIVGEIIPYYGIDRIKPYAVYIWSKDPYGENLFDVYEDKIIYFVDDHVISTEAMPIIEKIQAKLKEMRLERTKENK